MSNYIGLEFLDGATQMVRVLPIDLMLFERAEGRTPSSIEDTLRLVHNSLLRTGGADAVTADFDAWVAQVADIDPEPEETPAPLGASPSTTPSPDSP